MQPPDIFEHEKCIYWGFSWDRRADSNLVRVMLLVVGGIMICLNLLPSLLQYQPDDPRFSLVNDHLTTST